MYVLTSSFFVNPGRWLGDCGERGIQKVSLGWINYLPISSVSDSEGLSSQETLAKGSAFAVAWTVHLESACPPLNHFG